MFRHRAREDSCGAGDPGRLRTADSDHRYRGRGRRGRTGARDSRYAGDQQGFLAAFPAPLCRFARGDDRCGHVLC